MNEFPAPTEALIEASRYDPQMRITQLQGNLQNPSQVPELVPGEPASAVILRRYDHVTRGLGDMQEEDAAVREAAQGVMGWLEQNETGVRELTGQLGGPQLRERTVPPIGRHKLDLFKPKERAKRIQDGVTYSTDILTRGLNASKDEGETTFIKQLLPEGISVAEAMVLIDKDPPYRDAIAAACYRVLEQQDKEGLLDAHSRVKRNSDTKHVRHFDPALGSGKNRDVVVGMVLDSLTGRFNYDANRKSALALDEFTRGNDGAFGGGHHSGAAGGVVQALTTKYAYDRYFKEPYFTQQEKFTMSLHTPNVYQELTDPTLLKNSIEENNHLAQGIRMQTSSGDRKVLPPEATSLVIEAGNGKQPIALDQIEYVDDHGNTVKGVQVQYVREIASIRQTVINQARSFGLDPFSEEVKSTIENIIQSQRLKFVIPEGQTIAVGRTDNANIPLTKDPSVSRDHCQVTFHNGQFSITDTSSFGTMFRYYGKELNLRSAKANVNPTADTRKVPIVVPGSESGQPMQTKYDRDWNEFVGNVTQEQDKAENRPGRRIRRAVARTVARTVRRKKH